MKNAVLWLAAGVLALVDVARADDPPPDPNDHPDSTWSSRAVAGYSKTGGTTDTSSANGLFHVAHVMGDWKVLFGFEGLYGSTHSETTAQAWHAHIQGNYNFTDRLYWYAGYRQDNDKFSGFLYQKTVSTGIGYQVFKTDTTKLTVQGGVGETWLRPEDLVLDAAGGIVIAPCAAPNPGTCSWLYAGEQETVFAGALNFEQDFNKYTKLLASAAVQSGSLNTMTTYNVALQVKMTNQLALALGYQLVYNTSPPPSVAKSASLTTASLVYEFKNSKLPPD
jgi:putative salt-induced outer membrane protein